MDPIHGDLNHIGQYFSGRNMYFSDSLTISSSPPFFKETFVVEGVNSDGYAHTHE